MKYLCSVIHGPYGTGKTWFGASGPGPTLVIDTEGGAVYVPNQIDWTPDTGVKNLKKEGVYVFQATSFEDVSKLVHTLGVKGHPFGTIVLDSLTEGQRQLKQHVQDPDTRMYDPDKPLLFDGWGRMLSHGELVVRNMRDLSRPSAKSPCHTVIIVPSDTEMEPVKPLLQGALRKHLAGFVDMMGYLDLSMETDTDSGELQEVRTLRISPTPRVEAKCRPDEIRHHYGPVIRNPNLIEIVKVLNQGEKA